MVRITATRRVHAQVRSRPVEPRASAPAARPVRRLSISGVLLVVTAVVVIGTGLSAILPPWDDRPSHRSVQLSASTSALRQGGRSADAALGTTGSEWYPEPIARALLEPPTTAPLVADGKTRPFLVVGSQKCGTTSLFSDLDRSRHIVHMHNIRSNDGKERIRAWFEQHHAAPGDGAELLRSSPLYLTVADQIRGFKRKPPLLALDASPSMFDPWYARFVLRAFPNETEHMSYAAILCDPSHRAESAYWHALSDWWGHELRDLNITVSEKLYADVKELNACVRSTVPGFDIGLVPDDAIVLGRGPMRYSSMFNGDLKLPQVLAMMRNDASNGFPPLPAIDWSVVPDNWMDTCWAPRAGNFVASGLYAQFLRRLMFDLVVRPLGGQWPAWSSDLSKGLMSKLKQARFMVVENTEFFGAPRATVNRLLVHAGLPSLYGREDAVDKEAATMNVHNHAVALHVRVRQELDRFYEHEMALLERLTERGKPWFPASADGALT